MAVQGVSSNYVETIDLGNLVAYYAPTTFSSFAAAKSSTAWRKLGLLNGAQVQVDSQVAQFFSGVPQRLVQEVITLYTLQFTGGMLETRPILMALAQGMLQGDITTVLKAANPTPTTALTGSTQDIVKVASAAGFKEKKLIRVGTQFGIVKTINGTDFNMLDGLSGDQNPATGDAVSEVDTQSLKLGSVASAREFSIKLCKTIVTGEWEWELYIPRVKARPSGGMSFSDGGGAIDPIAVPFEFNALADSSVENGDLAQLIFTQS